MKLALRFLLFLSKLVSFFHNRWDQSTRRLWCIFAFVRSCILSRRPKKKGDEILRNVECRRPKSPTTVICASRFPPPLIPIAGGDTPITSPTRVYQRRTSDTVYETHENYGREHLDADPDGGRPILGTLDSAGYQNEPGSTHVALSPHQEDLASPVIHSRPTLHHPYRSASAFHPPSQSPYHSPPDLDGAEAAAREYIDGSQSPRCSSPVASVYPPSIAARGAPHVYRASRPFSQARRFQQMRNTPRRRVGFSTLAPIHQDVRYAPPELPQPESRTSLQLHRDSTAVSFGPTSPTQSKGSLRPMVAIDRYEKQRVVIEDKIHRYVFPPVTTEFVR